jgi:hypothetical protein
MRGYMARCRWSYSHIYLPPFGYYILQGNGTNPQRKGDAKCIYQIANNDSGAWDLVLSKSNFSHKCSVICAIVEEDASMIIHENRKWRL